LYSLEWSIFLFRNEWYMVPESPSPAALRELGNVSIVGMQWGDEGKGKIIDLLSSEFD
jgi:hypothetical protein